MEDEFNSKLGNWLFDVKCVFDKKEIQEEIFDLQANASIIGDDDREIELIKKLASSFLKLSFILKNNPTETEKLIQFLS